MAQSMTVRQLKGNAQALQDVSDSVQETLAAAQLEGQTVLYGDLSVALAMLSGAIEEVGFLLSRAEEEDAEDDDEIVDVL